MRIKSVLSVFGVFCLTLGVARAQTTLTNGLVAYWPFDVVNGSTTPDLALGNNMTLVNSPALVPGERTNCFQFTGSQYLDVMHSTNFLADGLPFYTTNGYTVAFWVQGLSTQAANHIPFSEVAFAGSMLLDFNTSSTKIRVFIRDNLGTTVINNVSSTAVVFDTTGTNWHHVAFTDFNGVCKLYIDGNADSAAVNYTAPSSGAPAATVTTVGGLLRSSGFADPFSGSVDEVMAWSRVLSQAEIQNAMSNGIPEPILPIAPTFVTPPANSTNAMGDRPIFSANVFGFQPISYQWYTNNVLIVGATTSTLALNTLTTPGTNSVTLVATNIAGANTNSATLVVLPDAPATNIDSGLIGYWPFNTLSNSSTSTPDLVSQNNFQVVNMSGANLVPGKFGNALSFDGATQYGSETTGTPIYNASTTYTVAFWVNGAGNQTDEQVFANCHTNGNYFFIGTDNTGASGKVDVRVNPGTADTLSTGTAFDGTWHHIAWVDQNGIALLYIDGVLDQTGFNYTRASVTLSNTCVGALVANSLRDFYAGDIDDLGTWNRRLSYTEIQSIIANGIPTPPTIVKPSVGTPTISESSVYQGDSITISAVTSGTSPTYQWYFGTNKISGGSNPSALTTTLSLSSVQPGQSGTYSLVATNLSGAATNSVVLTVIPYVPVTKGTALQVEFNFAAAPVVQSGFSSMTLAGNPATFGGPSITLSPIGSTSLSDRTRGNITSNNPPVMTTADLYEQIIFSTANTPGTGIDTFITRLAPNTIYGVTVWCYDQENSGISDWTATGSGSPVNMGLPGFAFYDFNGSTLPSADCNDTLGAFVTSSSTGTLDIQGVVDPNNTAITVFLNAMVLVANPVVGITSAGIATNGNLQVTVSTGYATLPLNLMESPDTINWLPANDAILISTNIVSSVGPVVTVQFPISASQNFYVAAPQ